MKDRFTSSSPDLRGVKAREVRDSVVIRFAGDSGDGMQFTGSQFTLEAALAGSDIATFPDYPAEIRAPAGTTYGVSAFQIHFGGGDLTTAGDEPDVLVALNPAALKVSHKDLRIGGLIVVDTGAFTKRNLAKAGYETSPLDDDTLAPYQLLKLDITQRTLDALEETTLKQKDALRSRNMWTLGLMLWMFGQEQEATAQWVERKFAKQPDIARANVTALKAGFAFGDTVEMPMDVVGYTVAKADLPPGVYRTVTGTEATAWGLLAGTQAAGLPQLFFGSYPITPATSLLHVLANLKSQGVLTFQAEDEIAAICASIGASYAGVLGVTSSSGPGIALKGEAMGLAVATELPLVIVNSQRAGPSTGMPTKTEQADLYQAVYGRNGDAPLPVLAAATPTDCFDVALEAVRLATKYMTPVMMLSDAYLANAAEPWLVPDADELPRFPVAFRSEPDGFQPFQRDPETLARPWAIPGTPGLEHRVGGLERDSTTGHISYDPDNHQRMTDARLEKVRRIADAIPEQEAQVGELRGALARSGGSPTTFRSKRSRSASCAGPWRWSAGARPSARSIRP
jgi:2-oxoglutarate ferredoxin oxidoreductase subunit alpha